jgi:hypothetical protein
MAPTAFRARVIRNVPFASPYTTFNRLSDLLKVGMSPEEVRRILGAPEDQREMPGGRRWVYVEDGSEATSGWLCVADFETGAGNEKLRYFCNIEHVVFPSSGVRQFGVPLQSNVFDELWVLNRRSKNSQ